MSGDQRPAKLRIVIERPGSSGATPQFDNSQGFEALFNPEKLVFNKTANWEKQEARTRNAPELQFKNAEPATLTVDLLFDTYDTPELVKKDVRREYTDKVMRLILVDAEKHRPPVCRLFWGAGSHFFQGVLKSLGYQFVLFTDDGTPVRARLNCTFQEWYGNVDVYRNPEHHSADLEKVWTVKRGDTLSRIAGVHYGDPTCWRPIALANGIEDPKALAPGRVLAIPRLPYKPV